MSREIKFRAWDNINKEMVYETTPIFFFGNCISNYDILRKYETVMQYAEIKDKKDKEIYEGDLVSLREAERRYVVKFHKGCFKLFHADPKLNDMLWGAIERVEELLWTIEVIGNIYENPELLSEQS